MLFSPLLGQPRVYPLVAGISGKGCAGSTGTCEVMLRCFHQNTGKILSILSVNSASTSCRESQDLFLGKGCFYICARFNWEKEPRKPKDIPHIIIKNMKCCQEKERGMMQREK